jgi:nitrite reductase/ring-hydroxylating ferredoxin subunit
MSIETFVADLSDVPEGEAREFDVDGMEVVLCNDGGEIYALQGTCTHQELPLDGAEVEDGVLTCEWHGATFDVETGRARSLPATRPLIVYEVRLRDGKVYIRPDAGQPIGRPRDGGSCSMRAGAARWKG